MLLLSAFLTIFLYKNYQRTTRELKQQSQLYLENAFKTAEGQILDKMLIELKGVSFLQNIDTIVRDIQVVDYQTSVLRIDSNFNSRIDTSIAKRHKTGFVLNARKENLHKDSLVSVKIEFKNDSFCIDTSFTNKDKADLSFVKKIFEKNIEKAGLNINYFFTDDPLLSGDSLNPRYTEAFTRRNYYLNIDHNPYYIFKKMFSDILLSCMLFIAITFAFYHIISSHRKNQEFYDLKDDFVRNMTHELKTPLATIGVAIEALQNFKADGDKNLRAEYLRIAESENRKLNNLVDKVLSITNELDKEGFQFIKTDLPQLIEEILESFKIRMDQKGIKYTFTNHLLIDNKIINPQIVALCLHNLLDNAIKYTNNTGPHIHIDTNEDENNLLIKVSDNGEPIPAEHAKRIFEKFYRIPNGNIHNIKGHGLGLYIIRHLMKSINGEIRLETSNSGNHFILRVNKNSKYR